MNLLGFVQGLCQWGNSDKLTVFNLYFFHSNDYIWNYSDIKKSRFKKSGLNILYLILIIIGRYQQSKFTICYIYIITNIIRIIESC